MDAQRTQDVQDAVAKGLQHWEAVEARGSGRSAARDEQRDVLVKMPVRRLAHKIEGARVELPMARKVEFKPGIFRPCLRLLIWLWLVISYFVGNAVDMLLGRG